MEDIKKLQEMEERLNKRYQFKPGDLVQWKEGMKNRGCLDYDKPAVVSRVLDVPIYEANESSESPYFGEPLDLVILSPGDDGGVMEGHLDSRRFEPYKTKDDEYPKYKIGDRVLLRTITVVSTMGGMETDGFNYLGTVVDFGEDEKGRRYHIHINEPHTVNRTSFRGGRVWTFQPIDIDHEATAKLNGEDLVGYTNIDTASSDFSVNVGDLVEFSPSDGYGHLVKGVILSIDSEVSYSSPLFILYKKRGGYSLRFNEEWGTIWEEYGRVKKILCHNAIQKLFSL